jgi:hypothetical protein
MAYQTFSDALMEAKRRAALQGRTVSQQEAAGITEGTAKSQGDRALQEYSINQQRDQFAQQLATQKEQFGSTLSLKEKEMAAQASQFGEQLSTQKDQFGRTLTLKEQEIANQRDQFGQTVGLREQEIATQKDQFGQTLATQKDQFTKDMALKTQSLQAQITASQNQLDMAVATLAEQKRQYEESSKTQKEQFGEQMRLQITESIEKIRQYEKTLDWSKNSFEQNLQYLRDQMNEQVKQANTANQDSGGGCCIIVTVCSNPTMKYVEGKGRNSYAVNVTRKYRDTLMPLTQLRGYYILAEILVPKMLESERWMQWAKRNIVDNVVPFCEWKIGFAKRPPLKTIIKAKAFLGICSMVGSTRPSFTRCNGEVF